MEFHSPSRLGKIFIIDLSWVRRGTDGEPVEEEVEVAVADKCWKLFVLTSESLAEITSLHQMRCGVDRHPVSLLHDVVKYNLDRLLYSLAASGLNDSIGCTCER